MATLISSRNAAEPVEPKPVCTLAVHTGGRDAQAAVFHLSGGRTRLVASTFASNEDEIINDGVMGSVREAVFASERLSGYSMISSDGDVVRNKSLTHAGVDQLAVSFTPTRPIQVMIIAPSGRDWGLDSARRGLSRFYCEVAAEYTGPITRSGMVEQLSDVLPDLVLITGGRGGWNRQSLGAVADGLKLAMQQLPLNLRPAIVYAADARNVEVIQSRLTQDNTPHILPPLRVNTRRERLNAFVNGIGEVISQLHLARMEGASELVRWGGASPELVQFSARRFIAYRARLTGQSVLWLDWSPDRLMAVFATPKRSQLAVLPELGYGNPLIALRNSIPTSKLNRWVTVEKRTEGHASFEDFWSHLGMNPHLVPFTTEEQLFHQSISRLILSHALDRLSALWGEPISNLQKAREFILGGGFPYRTQSVSELVNVWFDGIQPTGVSDFYLDPGKVVPMLGGSGQAFYGNDQADLPDLVALPLHESLRWVGHLISPSTKKRVRIRERQQGGSAEIGRGQLAHAQILPKGVETIQVRSGLFRTMSTLNGNAGRPIDLWIDTRGRPLRLPRSVSAKETALVQWRDQLANRLEMKR